MSPTDDTTVAVPSYTELVLMGKDHERAIDKLVAVGVLHGDILRTLADRVIQLEARVRVLEGRPA